MLASYVDVDSVDVNDEVRVVSLSVIESLNIKKWPLYCPQGSGTLRQQLLMMPGIAWYCMVLHGIAWY